MQALEAIADVRIFTDRCVSFDQQIERARGATAIINSRGYIKWQEEAFALLPDLKFITVCGIGTDSVDLEAARKRGILVSNIPGKTAPVVAEHAFGLMFEAACSTRVWWRAPWRFLRGSLRTWLLERLSYHRFHRDTNVRARMGGWSIYFVMPGEEPQRLHRFSMISRPKCAIWSLIIGAT
jgi:hypothetical protein